MKKRNPSAYHKIWRLHHGEIPLDEDGRRMEIHHIDGNHENNSIENLMLLTIKEHYHIHEQQGDVGACVAILMRMNVSPEDRRKLAVQSNQRYPHIARNGGKASYASQMKNGTHLFHQPNYQSNLAKKRTSEGTFHFQRRTDGTSFAMDQVKNGTNTFASSRNPNNTKISCLNCKKEVNLPIFYRNHFDNCKGSVSKSYDPANKISCIACRKTIVLPVFRRNHLSGICQMSKKDK